ncbi:MAG TPA: GAF domain-containing sensor histidine kinase [Candidatus Dormibacteraeota bacterium]
MGRRLVPYGLAVFSVAVVAAALGTLAWALGIARVETYWLIFILLIGSIAWRFGRGPAVLAAAAVLVLSDYYFLGQPGQFDVPSVSEAVRQLTGLLAAAAVIQFVHISRRREILLEKRKDLLQDVSPQILRSLDPEAILDTVAEATLRVIDYQHFRLYRWDDSSERLVLVKSVARAPAYAAIDWQNITFALGEGVTGRVGQSRKSLLIADASKDPHMIYPAGVQRLAESVLSVPMVTRDRLFGVLTLARLGVGSMGVEDLRVMESIAAQTALALANAEEHSEAEQTIKALALIESLQVEDASVPDAEVERSILSSFIDFSHAELATLRVRRNDGRFHLVATGGREWPAGEAPTGAPLTSGDLAWIADPKVPAYVADPDQDDKLPDWALGGPVRAQVKATVFLPLRAGQRLIGLIGLHWRRPRWFRGEQIGRLQLLAAQAAIALDTRAALVRERRRAEALAELERARREFMQIASHELRTPLTVIRGYASMLEDGSLGAMPSPARQAVKTLMDKSSEMRIQVERMLLLARLEDGAVPPQLAPVDLRTVVSEAVDRVRPQVDLKNGDVDVALTTEPLPVIGDSERLATAVDNLLQNAVKFSEGPPHIEVEGGRYDGRVTLVVRDHGVGIPESARSHLFEKFFRVHDPQLNNVAGTGIGLYLVRQVVEGHGGMVTVESQPGTGSSFKIELPAAAEVG